MKKTLAMLLAIAMLLSFVACGEMSTEQDNTPNATPSPSVATIRDYDESNPTAVLDEITNDFIDVTSQLTEKLAETFAAVGTTYEDYQKNKGLVDEWIELVLSESDALFARTKESSVAYFKLIAADEDHKYSEFCDEALDEYYDTVYDDALDEYYDEIYDDAMDDLYDEYYDGILDDAYDDLEYEEWSKASNECYEQWSDASSAIYKKWSNESSYVYGLWSAMNAAFCWDDIFDVDAIVAEYDAVYAEEEAKRAAEEAKVYVDFDVLYEINDDGDAEVVGFSGEGNRITISSEYEGEDVVRIVDSAFEDCAMLESIIMWADIEEIGNSAFKGCTGLTEFSVPSDTEVIGHHAFEGCTNLETLIIWGDPDIGEYAFADCVSLSEISIGSDTENVGAHAFEGCTGVTSLIIWGAEIIGDYAFASCTGIEDVSIPSDVLSVGNHAFDGCTALSDVIVWDDDTAIGEDAFANCPNLDDVPSARGKVLECTMSADENPEGNTDAELNEPTPDDGVEENMETDNYDESNDTDLAIGVVEKIYTADDIPDALMNNEFKNVLDLFSIGFSESGLDIDDATTYDDGETYIFYLNNIEFLGNECEDGVFQPRIIYSSDAINNNGNPDRIFLAFSNPLKSNGYEETVEMIEDIADALDISDSGLIDNDYSSSSAWATGEYATFTFPDLGLELVVSNTDSTVEIEIVSIDSK